MQTRATTARALSKTAERTIPPAMINTHCAFLSLPPELRNHIYEFSLFDPKNGWMLLVYSPCGFRDVDSGPALTKTCRQIRSETLNIFYERNAFHFFCFEDEPNPTSRQIPNSVGRMNVIDITFSFSHPGRLRFNTSKGLANYQLDIVTGNDESSLSVNYRPRRLVEGRKFLDECISKANPSTIMTGELFLELLKIIVQWQ